MGFFFWYSSSYTYTDKGLQKDDEKVYAQALHEHIAFVDVPKLVGWASDFDHIKAKNRNEIQYLAKLNSDLLNNRGPKVNPKKGVMKNYKTNLLILFYLARSDINEAYRKEMLEIIEKIPSITELLLEISMIFHVNYRQKRFRKNMSFKAMHTIVKFSQHCIQGTWENASELLQLPHMTDEKITRIMKSMRKRSLSIKDYIKLTPEQRKAHKALTDDELESVEECISNLPKIKLTSEIKTDGSQDIVIFDVVTIKVTIEREELKEDEKAPHA